MPLKMLERNLEWIKENPVIAFTIALACVVYFQQMEIHELNKSILKDKDSTISRMQKEINEKQEGIEFWRDLKKESERVEHLSRTLKNLKDSTYEKF